MWNKEGVGTPYEFEIIPRLKTEIWTGAIVGGQFLYNRKSRYTHRRWPAVFFTGQKRRGEPIPYGKVDGLITPQDLLNMLVSLVGHNASRTNQMGVLVNKSRFATSEHAGLKEKLQKPGFYAELEEGNDQQNPPLTQVGPQGLPMQVFELIQFVMAIFDKVSGLAEVQRGGMNYPTSGKGIQQLLQAGDMTLSNLQNNVKHSLTTWGNIRVRNIQQFYTMQQSWRISDDFRSYILSIEPNDTDTGMQMVRYDSAEPGTPKASAPPPRAIVPDLSVSEFDVKVSIRSMVPRTPEEEIAEAQAQFEMGLVTRAFLAKKMDIPADEVEKAMKENKVLQSGMLYDKLGKESPIIAKALELIAQNPKMAEQALAHLGQPQAAPIPESAA